MPNRAHAGRMAAIFTMLVLALAVTAPTTKAQQYYGGTPGPGMMGPGMMGYGMMGPGMMGSGYMGCPNCGMMGYWGPRQANLSLSVGDVKGYLEQWITSTGNKQVKVGNIAETDANTITADIVSIDKDALVQRFSVDRHTGLFHSVQ